MGWLQCALCELNLSRLVFCFDWFSFVWSLKPWLPLPPAISTFLLFFSSNLLWIVLFPSGGKLFLFLLIVFVVLFSSLFRFFQLLCLNIVWRMFCINERTFEWIRFESLSLNWSTSFVLAQRGGQRFDDTQAYFVTSLQFWTFIFDFVS